MAALAPPLAPSSSATWTVQAGWELDLFGAARASRDAAGARADAAALTLDHARQSLAVEVAQALLACRHADAQLALARTDEALAERLARADADARTATQAWLEQRGAWLQTLALLVADDAAALAPQLGGSALPTPTALTVSVLPATLLERRADLAAALRQWQAAALEAQGTAIAQYAPQLSFSALVGRGRWEMGAAARRREAEATLGHWQRIADASRAQQRAGLLSGQNLARDERNALTARSDALDAAREHSAAYLQLVRALGGGWTAPKNT